MIEVDEKKEYTRCERRKIRIPCRYPFDEDDENTNNELTVIG